MVLFVTIKNYRGLTRSKTIQLRKNSTIDYFDTDEVTRNA